MSNVPATIFFHPPMPDRGPEALDRAEAGKGYVRALSDRRVKRQEGPCLHRPVGNCQERKAGR